MTARRALALLLAALAGCTGDPATDTALAECLAADIALDVMLGTIADTPLDRMAITAIPSLCLGHYPY
jgi:hypothetical protein